MTLIEEIKAIDGYDALTDQQAADSVNAARLADQDNYVLGTYLTERGLYDLLGPEAGETVIATLEAAGSQNPALARVAKWLSPNEGGLDVGNAKTQAQLIALSDANGGPLAAASVLAIRSHGLREKPAVTAEQVLAAIEADAIATLRESTMQSYRDVHSSQIVPVLDGDDPTIANLVSAFRAAADSLEAIQ